MARKRVPVVNPRRRRRKVAAAPRRRRRRAAPAARKRRAPSRRRASGPVVVVVSKRRTNGGARRKRRASRVVRVRRRRNPAAMMLNPSGLFNALGKSLVPAATVGAGIFGPAYASRLLLGARDATWWGYLGRAGAGALGFVALRAFKKREAANLFLCGAVLSLIVRGVGQVFPSVAAAAGLPASGMAGIIPRSVPLGLGCEPSPGMGYIIPR